MKKTLVYKVIIVLVALMLFVGCVGNTSNENIEYSKDDVYGNSAFDTQYEVIEAKEDEGIDVLDGESSFFKNVIQGVSDVFSSEEETTMFENINMELKESEISETEYSKLILNASFYPDEVKSEYGNTIYNNTKVDVSNDLQRVVNDFENLDKDEIKKLREILFVKNIESNNGWSDFFISTVKAEDVLSFSYEVGIGTKIYIENMEFYEEYTDLLELWIEQAKIKYELLDFAMPMFQVEFNFVTLPLCVDSYSTYVPLEAIMDEDGVSFEPVFKIFIDMNLHTDEVQAAIYHELFHAYQYEAGLTQVTQDAKWLKEATAMWAVDQVDRELNYEHRYIHYLYSNFSIDTYAITDIEHSWYQMFQYFTEDIRAYDTDYVSDLINSFAVTESLDESFVHAHQARQFLNEDFAQFAMALFNNENGEDGIKSLDSDYPNMGIVLEEENFFDFDILMDSFGAEWQGSLIEGAGIKPLIIKIPDDFDSQVNIMINIPYEKDEKKAGAVVGTYSQDEWTFDVKDGLYEKSNYVYDVGEASIEAICLLLYNTDFNEDGIVEFKIGIGVPDNAEGTIKYTITRDLSKGEAGVKYDDEVQFTLTESLSRYEPESTSSELIEYQRNMYGDTYYVDEMTIDYKYTSHYEKGDDKEIVTSNGLYFYNGTDSEIGGLGGMLSGLGDLIPGMSSDPTPSGGEPPSDGGLGDILSGLGELGEGFDLELPDGLGDIGGMLGLDTLGRLKRFTIKSEMDSFEILPMLPSDLTSEEWIDTETKITYKDNDGQLKTDTINKTEAPGELFPIWFINPNYDVKAGEQLASEEQNNDSENFMDNIEDSKEILDKVKDLNNKFNKYNVSALIKDPNTSIGIDLTKIITSLEEGEQYEKLMFNGNSLKGEITATFTTQSGNFVTVKIEYNYTFK